VRSAQLRGPEHAILGGIAVVAEGALAIALSRGGAAKRYRHREPNEDAAGFAWSEWGAALAIADGHEGSAAACLAVERALACAPRWLEREPVALADRFAAEAEALVRSVHQQILRQREAAGARTTLAVALARPREGWLGLLSIGDSLLFTHGDAGTRRLGAPAGEAAVFLGAARLDAREIRAATFVDVRSLRGERAVVLASDGFSQPGIGVADPEAAISQAFQEAARAGAERASQALARGLVERALRVQLERRSGDNVAAAVLWLGSAGSRDHQPSTPLHLPEDPQDGRDERGDRALAVLRPR
jgi:serine/threonine protein phosphatase PrpC